MADLIKAARKDDLVAHDMSQAFRILGELGTGVAFLWRGTQIVTVALMGWNPGGWALIGASIVVEYAVCTLVDIAADEIGQLTRSAPIPAIEKGSNNIGINGRPAARGGTHDPVKCHPGNKIKHGSLWVAFNQKPAARVGDTTDGCSGKIATGSENVFIGGPEATRSERAHAAQEYIGYIFTGLSLRKAYIDEGKRGLFNEAVEAGGGMAVEPPADMALDAIWGSVFE